MDIIPATAIIREKMELHGLPAQGWKMAFSNAEGRAASCSHRTRTLRFSRRYIERDTPAQFTQTVLHEIAHALVGPRCGHGPIWQAKVVEIGGVARRCTDPLMATEEALEAASDITMQKGLNLLDSNGQVYTVIKKNRVRWAIVDMDGREYAIIESAARLWAHNWSKKHGEQKLQGQLRDAMERVAARPRHARPVRSTQTAKRENLLPVGTRLRLPNGTLVKITKAARTNYHAQDKNGTTWAVPFAIADRYTT